ncbi:Threonine dehydrogenase-like Zn-dependent dehydrogenase [Modestobacter italicus]|uniref:Threonine dehydrogenase-like Zn-dependent dehydrogenase n=1 Tax=Modestobacter italicus (strain DSM 44449 / CECT 9708 / BC 501) TaxID=2732864 RepID=I4ET18_MODI5|nr:zinc-binding dehydrogenase [Modestobacter marinus]CCH86531.1 Threonine dehydrogenase-like Zn-dependent dehydrogenase [Modestobacter marinus]
MSGRQVRAIGVAEPGRPVVLDDVEPEPDDGQAWVHTLWSGVSAGTEAALVRGTDPHHQVGWDIGTRSFGAPGAPLAGYPVPGLGYMEVGRVLESRTADLAEGTVVAMAYGHRTGRCADPARSAVIPVPDDLDPLLGVYLAQMGPICVNGLLHAAAALAGPGAGLADGVRGQHVLVTGGGVIGLVTAMLAERHGAAEVLVVEPSADRRRVAEALGLQVLDDTGGEAWWAAKQRWQHGPGDAGADVVLQCQGHDTALATALKALRPQGVVVDLGFHQGGAGAVRLGEEFHHNGLSVVCAQISRVPRGMGGAWPRTALAAATLDLLRDRGDEVRRHLVTDVVPFDDGPALLADIAARRLASPPLQAVLRFAEPG